MGRLEGPHLQLVPASTIVLYFKWAQIVAKTATFTMSGFCVFYAFFHRGANYTMPNEGAATKLNQGYALGVFYILATYASGMCSHKRPTPSKLYLSECELVIQLGLST